MIFVLDQEGTPLDMCSEARARQLLKSGKAHVKRSTPFVLQMNSLVNPSSGHTYNIGIDPGSRHTGLALVRDDGLVCYAVTINHRTNIADKMKQRGGYRRGRRSRIRNREARFENRTPVARRNPKNRPESRKGEPQWFPPTHESRMANILTWVARFTRWANVAPQLYYEDVKFDIQLINNPDIEGVGYQRGPLWGREVREYLRYIFGAQCVYGATPRGWSDDKAPPSTKKGKRVWDPSCTARLEIEHLRPRSRKGSDKVANLALSCSHHNTEKGSRTLEEYGAKVGKNFTWVRKRAGTKLNDHDRDATWMNIVRKEMPRRLQALGFHVKRGSGGKTSFNRRWNGLPKRHWVDAACVGPTRELRVKGLMPLVVEAKGHGSRQTAGNLGSPQKGDLITLFLGEVSQERNKDGTLVYPEIFLYGNKGIGKQRREMARRLRQALKRICEKGTSGPERGKYGVTVDLFEPIMEMAYVPPKRRGAVREALMRAFRAAKRKSKRDPDVWWYSDMVWLDYHVWVREGRPSGKIPGHIRKDLASHDLRPGDVVYGEYPETSRGKHAGKSFHGRLSAVQYQKKSSFVVEDRKLGRLYVNLDYIRGRTHTGDGYVYSFGEEVGVNLEAQESFRQRWETEPGLVLDPPSLTAPSPLKTVEATMTSARR